MQVNKKIEEVCNKEFFYESYFIIKNNLIDEMFKYGYETNVKCNSKKILIIFKSEDILLDIQLTNEMIKYRIVLFHTRPKVDKSFVYCKYEEVKVKEDFKKFIYQFKEVMKKLINYISHYDMDKEKDSFIIDNEFKYSSDYKIPKRNSFSNHWLEYDENE